MTWYDQPYDIVGERKAQTAQERPRKRVEIRIATRKSELALWQAKHVAERKLRGIACGSTSV